MVCTQKLNDLALTTADVVDVPVTLSQDGVAFDLTGYTVTCWVGGVELTVGSGVTIDDAADGLLTLSLDVPALGLPLGESKLELRGAIDGKSRALLMARVLVLKSQAVA